jgi:small subunit ribosomal protein S20
MPWIGVPRSTLPNCISKGNKPVATHKSSVKRARQDLVKGQRNRQYLSAVRTSVKKFKMAVQGAGIEPSKAQELFTSAQSMLAKAAQKGVIHTNNASRKIERLSKMLKKMSTGVVDAVTDTKAKVKKAAAAPKAKTAAKKTAAAKAKKTATKKKK